MIIAYQDLKKIRQDNSGKKIVFADGTFDLFHLGHVESFKNLHSFGDLVVIGVMSDEWVKEKKGQGRPVLSEKERLTLVDSIRYVDFAFLLKDLASGKRIKTSEALALLKPNIFVTVDPSWETKRTLIEDIGGKLMIIPRSHKSSTTELLERIKKTLL